MGQSDTPEPAPEATPLDQFSQCHAGILAHLQDFARLPALLEPAAQARRIAGETLRFFQDVIYEHHAEEEKDLFPAVLASAVRGVERDQVQAIVDRLTQEHRRVEAAWTRIAPHLKDIEKGRDAALDVDAVETLVREYQAHAAYEEQEFLPLSEKILGRDSRHMAALGLSLHMRHALPEALARFRGRI
jgi:hemerythrin superfamily protein